MTPDHLRAEAAMVDTEAGHDATTRAALLRGAADEIERLRRYKIPTEDIDVALRANNMGGLAYREDACQCDPSVGCSPCPYCAIDSVLGRLAKAAGIDRPCPPSREAIGA